MRKRNLLWKNLSSFTACCLMCGGLSAAGAFPAMAETRASGMNHTAPVLFGTEEPWLFYIADDGQPLETYMRTNLFSEQQLQEITENIDTLRSELEVCDIKFVLMIAPDKEEIYGEDYMPPEIAVAPGPTRTEQLIDYMEQNAPEVCVVYPGEALKAAKNAYEGVDALYYKSDTHWNYVGGYVGAVELIKTISQHTGYTWEERPRTFELTGTVNGDLQVMAGLSGSYNSLVYTPVPLPAFESTKKILNAKNNDILWESGRSLDENCLPLSVYVTGDSFRSAASCYLKETFSDWIITSRYYLDTEDLVARKPDVFVYMIVERYLHELSVLPGYNTMALQMPEAP